MLTMGKHVTHWKETVHDGLVTIDHTFKTLPESYEDELKMFKLQMTHEMKLSGLNYVGKDECKLSDHVILWLYRVRKEKRRDEKGQIVASPDVTHRTYFIGSVALNMIELLKCSINSASNKLFHVRHNFMATHVICTVKEEKDATKKLIVQQNIDFLTKQSQVYQEMQEELKKFDVANKLRPDEALVGPAANQRMFSNCGVDFVDDVEECRILSILTDEKYNERNKLVKQLKEFPFHPSPLRNLAEINELVQLEQVRREVYSGLP
jgi:hypothetical protein